MNNFQILPAVWLSEHHSKFYLCLWVVPSETPSSTPSSSCSEAPSPSQPQVSFSFSHPCFWAGPHHSPTLIQTLEGNLGFSTDYWIWWFPLLNASSIPHLHFCICYHILGSLPLKGIITVASQLAYHLAFLSSASLDKFSQRTPMYKSFQ